jgi:hypothetical protein
MSSINTMKLSGRTAASTDGTATGIVATLAVDLHSDNILRWVDATGRTHSLEMTGELASLLQALFTGAGGVNTAWLK